MKNKIKETLKASRLKTWKVFAEIVVQDKSNFKRRMFQNIDRINEWLKHIGLELYVKEIDVNTSVFGHKLNSTHPIPTCNDFYSLLGAVKGKEYSCPKCGKQECGYDVNDGYDVNGDNYPKYYNGNSGCTIDGSYWDWDEVHACSNCGTKYWFRNGAY